MRSTKRIATGLCVVMVLILAAALFVACDKKPDHEHVFEEIYTTATCTEGGIRIVQCKECYLQQQENCSALGHDVDSKEMTVIVAPTCTSKGSGRGKCDRCFEEVDVDIPEKEHNIQLDYEKSKSPTCTKDGIKIGECRTCHQHIEQVTPALGHDFSGESVVSREASCEEDGERVIKCKRKNCDGDEKGTPATRVISSPKLGHDWQESTTLDKEPSFTDEGSRSIHCNRCEKTKDVQSIPKLVAGQRTTYQFRIARPNRECLKVGVSGVTLIVKDSEGHEVARSNRDNFNQVTATMTVELEPKDYTVEVSGLPDGYSSKKEYKVGPGTVELDLTVSASLLPEEEASDSTKYELGSVLHDYTFRDVRGNKDVKLSELLAEKKIVLLNFFFVTCGACQTEMPGLISAYNLYKEDIAVVMLDVVPYDTPEGIDDDFLKPFDVPKSWYAVQDITPDDAVDTSLYNNICEKFGFTSAPQNVIIDSEGVVVYKRTGATSEMDFRNIFKKYSSAPYSTDKPENETPEQTAKTAMCDVDIPRKDDSSRKEEY